MSLPLPTQVHDPLTRQALDAISNAFPIQAGQIANSAVTNANLAGEITTAKLKGEITDAKLSKPVIAGAVSSAGAVVSGEGFTSEKTGTGLYKITLSVELATQGIIALTGKFAGSGVTFTNARTTGKKVFEVEMFGFSAGSFALANSEFHFMVKAS